MYILDGLRAKDIATIGFKGDEGIAEALAQRWQNPLDDLGQRVLAADSALSGISKLQIAQRATAGGNTVLASDLVACLMRSNSVPMNFERMELRNGDFRYLPLGEREISNLRLVECYIGELGLPVKGCTKVTIENCITPKVSGVASRAALPVWITNLDAEEFDSVASVSRIRKLGLKPAHEILTAIIRKTFFQKGSGRKEEALLRGLGTVTGKSSLSSRILNIMMREGLLSTFKGNEGLVYSPERSHTRRMQAILDELGGSRDSLWIEVGTL